MSTNHLNKQRKPNILIPLVKPNRNKDSKVATERNFGKDIKNLAPSTSHIIKPKETKPKITVDIACIQDSLVSTGLDKRSLRVNEDKLSCIDIRQKEKKNSSYALKEVNKDEEFDIESIPKMDLYFKGNLNYVTEYSKDIFDHVFATEVSIILNIYL